VRKGQHVRRVQTVQGKCSSMRLADRRERGIRPARRAEREKWSVQQEKTPATRSFAGGREGKDGPLMSRSREGRVRGKKKKKKALSLWMGKEGKGELKAGYKKSSPPTKKKKKTSRPYNKKRGGSLIHYPRGKNSACTTST